MVVVSPQDYWHGNYGVLAWSEMKRRKMRVYIRTLICFVGGL